MKERIPQGCKRLDSTHVEVTHKVSATIFANDQVPLEEAAVSELKRLLELQETAERMYGLNPEAFSEPPTIQRVALTPDFHKGSGIPIGTVMQTRGFVVPQAIGNDINCGVRLHRTSLTIDDVVRNKPSLIQRLRHIFFEGGRAIPTTREQRYALLTGGLSAFIQVPHLKEGVWNHIDIREQQADLLRTQHRGSFVTSGVFGLSDYLKDEVMRDSQIGSVGGSNHFVELQYVNKVYKGATAFAWGLRQGTVVAMIHTGSVNIGHLCGGFFKEKVISSFPKTLSRPSNGIYPLPDRSRFYDIFFESLYNAANFAFANRLFLGAMLHQAMSETIKEHDFKLIYDSPHNFAWKMDDGSILHRKGACPAQGIGVGCDPYYGEVVLVPGSMGTASFIMEGLGNPESLYSASHGAGRQLSRGDALKQDDSALDFLKTHTIVTPVDPNRQDIKSRKEILEKWRDAVKQESPSSYKDIYPVMDTLRDAKIAEPVAELLPLLTIKA